MLGEHDLAKVITMSFLGKGRLNCKHFIHENSHAPTVNLIIVVVPLSHFRRDVVEGAAESAALLISFDGPPEVGDFEVVTQTDDVLRFEVPMNDSVPVQILYSGENLLDVVGSFVFRKGSFP